MKGDEQYYTASSKDNTYTWNIVGGTILSGQGTDSIVVDWTGKSQGTIEFIDANTYCADTAYADVSLYANPVADMTISGPCVGRAVAFEDVSTGNDNRTWDFGNSQISVLASPFNIYTSAGTYDVVLVVTSDKGCVDSINPTA